MPPLWKLNDFDRYHPPIIQSIDTYEYNQKLGIAFEARIGKGSLFILCADPDKDIEKTPCNETVTPFL